MNMHTMTKSMAAMFAGVGVMAGAFTGDASADIPDRPEQLTFPELKFDAPNAADYRHELPNGVRVYMAPSDEFPLIDLRFTFKSGSHLDPDDQPGLAAVTASMMRRGGTTTMTAEELDERLEFLAANVSTYDAGATMNCLSSNFDESFDLFIDMLRNPGFQEDKLELLKDEQIESMKQRNDAPFSVLGMIMPKILNGPDHYTAQLPTKDSIESISPDDLREMHQRIFHPGNLVIAVHGDFEPQMMLDKLSQALDGWQAGEPVSDPPAPSSSFEPGLYHADVAKDELPQGTVMMGLRTIERDHPDYFPMTVMNEILGGGGFTSRITQRVRSDEGLAYSAGSFFQPSPYYAGPWGAFFQSKNSTCALAAKIVMEEVERMRTEPVSDEELESAKNAFIESFPQQFSSKNAMLNVFVSDDLTDRPDNYWQDYRDNIRDVTSDDVMKAAQTHLHPDGMAILVIGKWDEIYPGDPDGRASMNDFFHGDVKHMPMLDPLTLEPMKN